MAEGCAHPRGTCPLLGGAHCPPEGDRTPRFAAKAEHEYLYDKPYEDKKRVRVAGPFTVESLSPHRMSPVDETWRGSSTRINAAEGLHAPEEREAENYHAAIMENLAKAGVHQSGKEDAIDFESLTPWPGEWISAEGRYLEGRERGGNRAPRRHLYRAGIRHRQPRGSRCLRARGLPMPASTS